MKLTPCLSRAALSAAAFLSLSSLPAVGAVLWVDEVLATPTTYTGTPTGLTDQTNSTGWSDITTEGTATLTLGWSVPFTNDGTGVIKITSALNLFPMPPNSGFDIRLLLSDGSYSETYTVSESTGVRVLDFVSRIYVSRQTILIDDVYDGPLAVKGIEFTNPNPYDNAGVPDNRPLNLRSVLAEVPPEPDDQAPEPTSALLVALGGILISGRRRR